VSGRDSGQEAIATGVSYPDDPDQAAAESIPPVSGLKHTGYCMASFKIANIWYFYYA
jgi:hypothetical protein